MTVPLDKPVTCPVLIGRTRELAALHSLIDVARDGQGRVALISGEAGIGKSRLIAEAKTYAAAQEFLLLQGYCFLTDTSCPYAPLWSEPKRPDRTSSQKCGKQVKEDTKGEKR